MVHTEDRYGHKFLEKQSEQLAKIIFKKSFFRGSLLNTIMCFFYARGLSTMPEALGNRMEKSALNAF